MVFGSTCRSGHAVGGVPVQLVEQLGRRRVGTADQQAVHVVQDVDECDEPPRLQLPKCYLS